MKYRITIKKTVEAEDIREADNVAQEIASLIDEHGMIIDEIDVQKIEEE